MKYHEFLLTDKNERCINKGNLRKGEPACVYEGTMMKINSMRIERKRLTDQIIDQLIAMVTDGKLKPGDKLPSETILMGQFGVGRSSLREAIGALSLIGMLTVRPGHGTHVAPSAGESFSKPLRWGMFVGWREKLHEFIEARISLEQTLVGMAAERASEADIEGIRRGLNMLKSPKLTKRRAIQADLEFHMAIANASHNSCSVEIPGGAPPAGEKLDGAEGIHFRRIRQRVRTT